MTTDPRLNDIIKQLQEKVKKLKELSAEMRSKSKKGMRMIYRRILLSYSMKCQRCIKK